MFELTSENVSKFEITLKYAKEKLDKSKLSKLVKVA